MVAEKGEININKGLHENERLSEFREGKQSTKSVFIEMMPIKHSELGVVLFLLPMYMYV